MPKKQLKGTIVSDKMQKTVVVRVETIKIHPKYQKRFKAHKNFKAANPNGEYHVGDNVLIQESIPMSKDKRWNVIGRL